MPGRPLSTWHQLAQIRGAFERRQVPHGRVVLLALGGERRLRAHHLAHHFRNPLAYHGVTTRFWDRALGTLPAHCERDYARVADRPPLPGRSNFGQLRPTRL